MSIKGKYVISDANVLDEQILALNQDFHNNGIRGWYKETRDLFLTELETTPDDLTVTQACRLMLDCRPMPTASIRLDVPQVTKVGNNSTSHSLAKIRAEKSSVLTMCKLAMQGDKDYIDPLLVADELGITALALIQEARRGLKASEKSEGRAMKSLRTVGVIK